MRLARLVVAALLMGSAVLPLFPWAYGCGTNIACSNAIVGVKQTDTANTSSQTTNSQAGTYSGDLLVVFVGTITGGSAVAINSVVDDKGANLKFVRSYTGNVGTISVYAGVIPSGVTNAADTVTSTFSAQTGYGFLAAIWFRGTANSTWNTYTGTSATTTTNAQLSGSYTPPTGSFNAALVIMGASPGAGTVFQGSFAGCSSCGNNLNYGGGGGAVQLYQSGYMSVATYYGTVATQGVETLGVAQTYDILDIVFRPAATGGTGGIVCDGGNLATAGAAGVTLAAGTTYLYSEVVNKAGFTGETFTSMGVKVFSDGVLPASAANMQLGVYVTPGSGAVGGGNPANIAVGLVGPLVVPALIAAGQTYYFNFSLFVQNGYTVAWAVSSTQSLKLYSSSIATSPATPTGGASLLPNAFIGTSSALTPLTLFICGYGSQSITVSSTTTTFSSGSNLFSLGFAQALVTALTSVGLDQFSAGWILTIGLIMILVVAVGTTMLKNEGLHAAAFPLVIVAVIGGIFIASVGFHWIDPLYALFTIIGLVGVGALTFSRKVFGGR